MPCVTSQRERLGERSPSRYDGLRTADLAPHRRPVPSRSRRQGNSCQRCSVNLEAAAGVVLIVAPLWFNTTFTLLGNRFDYPDILRRPTTEILERFRAGGSSLILLWW